MTQDNTITESEALRSLSILGLGRDIGNKQIRELEAYIHQSASQISDLTRERDEALKVAHDRVVAANGYLEREREAKAENTRLQTLLDEACMALEEIAADYSSINKGHFDAMTSAITALSKIRGLGSSPDLRSTPEVSSVKLPKCGKAGEISLPKMGLDYFYNPDDWEWTQNSDDDSCIADWLSESRVDVMSVQTLINGPLLFAANIPINWNDDGSVGDCEITYFDTEEDAKAAIAAAQPQLSSDTAQGGE